MTVVGLVVSVGTCIYSIYTNIQGNARLDAIQAALNRPDPRLDAMQAALDRLEAGLGVVPDRHAEILAAEERGEGNDDDEGKVISYLYITFCLLSIFLYVYE